MHQELASYKTSIEANADKAFLESRGIKTKIVNEHVVNAQPELGVVGGVKLLVEKDDLGRARQLLNENR